MRGASCCRGPRARVGEPLTPDGLRQRLMLSLLGWFGEPTNWTGTAPLHTIAAAVAATLPTSIALPRQVLGAPIIVSGCALLAAWLSLRVACHCGA